MRKFMILMAAIVVTMMPSIAKASTTVGVTVSNITDNSATVVFDKSESDYGYYAMIDRNNSVSEMVQNYANMGITKTEQEVFEMFVSQYPSGFLYLADTTLHITGLNAGTEIPIYTISTDNAGELTGTFDKTVFETTLTTGGTGLAEIGLSITDVTSYGCHLETSMNDQTAYFYFTAGKTATFVNHNLTDAESVLNYLMDNNWETWNHDLIGSYGTADEPLSSNTEYQVWLFPFNQNRELGTPTSQTFTTLSSSGIDDADVIQVSIYPNPVRNLLTVKNAEAFSRAELYNAAGQLMLRQSVQGSSCTLDVSNLKRGGYYLLLTGTKGTVARKIIVE